LSQFSLGAGGGGAKSRYGRSVLERSLLPLTGIETRTTIPYPVAILTDLCRI
jgi:hypothetical protein